MQSEMPFNYNKPSQVIRFYMNFNTLVILVLIINIMLELMLLYKNYALILM